MRPIDRIKLEFDFDRLLVSDGYSFNPKRSVSENGTYLYKIFHKLDGRNKPIETIQRGWGTGGHQVYLNLNDSTDSGSVIDYLQKHHSLSFKEIFAFVENFDASISIPQVNIKQSPNKKTKVSYQVLDSEPVSRSNILNQRKLLHLINTSRFKNSINVCTVKATTEDGKKSKRFRALGLPLTNQQGQTSVYTLKSTSFKTSLFTGPRRACIWLSEITEGPIAFFESAFDAMSHYELYPNDYTYISSEGRFSTSFIETVKNIIPNLSTRDLVFGNDNDLDGHLYDFQWLHHLHGLNFTASKHVFTDPDDAEKKDPYIVITSENTTLLHLLEIQYGDTIFCNDQQRFLSPDSFTAAFKTICKHYHLDHCTQVKSRLKDFNEDLQYKASRKEKTRSL